MTREEAAEYAELLQAYANGETIEYRDTCCNDAHGWWVLTDVTDFIDEREFRIKPKPREFWLNIYVGAGAIAHDSKKWADENAGRTRVECIKVREVIDDA